MKFVNPPKNLYLTATTRNGDDILQNGFTSESAPILLYQNREDAIRQIKKKGKPMVLCVDAKSMHANGEQFFTGKNNTWYAQTNQIQACFLKKS